MGCFQSKNIEKEILLYTTNYICKTCGLGMDTLDVFIGHKLEIHCKYIIYYLVALFVFVIINNKIINTIQSFKLICA